MQLNINENVLVFLQKKYGRLLHVICNNISGDPAVLSSHEDNEQELLIKAIEAVYSYSKKIDEPDIESFLETVNFDKYIKTCLWNLKNNFGCTIQKKHSKKKYSLDLRDKEVLRNIEAVDNSYSVDPKITNLNCKRTTALLDHLVSNPNCITDFDIEEISLKFRGKRCQ